MSVVNVRGLGRREKKDGNESAEAEPVGEPLVLLNTKVHSFPHDEDGYRVSRRRTMLDTPMRMIVEQIRNRIGARTSRIRLVVNGAFVEPGDTAEKIGLRGESSVDAYLLQLGPRSGNRDSSICVSEGVSEIIGDSSDVNLMRSGAVASVKR